MAWLNHLVRPPARLTGVFRYGRPFCLLGLFPERFRHVRQHAWRAKCGRPLPPDWRTSRLAFEFHTWGLRVFRQHVRPQLAWLRQQYARAGGRVVVATLLREPASHLLSFYRMAPPLSGTGALLPVSAVLGGAGRLQQRLLVGRAALSGRSWRAREERPCGVDLAESRALLRDFDIVGVFEPSPCLGLRFYELVLTSLRIPVFEASTSYHRYYARSPVRPVESGSTHGEAKRLSDLAGLDPAIVEALRNVTACDRVLYEEAAQKLASSRCGGALEYLCPAEPVARHRALRAFFTPGLLKGPGFQRAKRLTDRLIASELSGDWDVSRGPAGRR